MERIYTVDVIELKKEMVERNLDKIVDLSKVSKIDRNTLAKVVNGEMQPSTTVIDKLIPAMFTIGESEKG